MCVLTLLYEGFFFSCILLPHLLTRLVSVVLLDEELIDERALKGWTAIHLLSFFVLRPRKWDEIFIKSELGWCR